MNRFFFLSTALFIATGTGWVAVASSHAYAGSGTSCEHYSGHASVEGKWGSERSITETAAFMPIACSEDKLLYGDVRLKADNRGNREGNVGVGVRALKEDGVAGGYVYLDRRRSGATEKLFTQTTLGAEWLAEDWEVRGNAYVPLSGKKQMGIGGGEALGDPYLAGSGIYVDVAAQNAIIEKPLWGADAEVGLKLPGKDFWMHAGVFAFDASEAEGLAGGRVRATYKVTDNIALTAEGQYDDVRGRQGWLGVRYTIPFGDSKTKYKGLKNRMTADPVRDVDIVTAAVEQEVTPEHTAPVENTSTQAAQRVLHVDNSAGGGGDGTLENPFNTLAAAQAILQDFDVLYINRGTGTTAGMNAGLTVSQSNVQVIGSGTDFVYDAGRFYAPVEDNFGGTVLVAAGAAPVITNAGVNGDGINVTGANAWIGGVTVNGSTRYGIYALASAGVDLENITVHDVTVSSNGQYGIWFSTTGAGARIGEATIRDVTASNNGDRGALVSTAAAATIETVTVDNLVSHDSVGDHGVEISADGAGSSITNIRVSDSEFYNNSTGAYIRLTNNALLDFLELTDVNSHNNTGRGVLVHALSGADINTIEADGITGQANTVQGMEISSQAAGSSIGSAAVRNSSFTGNSNVGLHVNATTSSLINSVEIENITASTNANAGVQVAAATAADIDTVTIDGVTASGNTTANGRGVYVDVNGAGSTLTTANISNITASSNGASGLFVTSASNGLVSTLNVSNVSSNQDDSRGIYLLAQTGGDIGTITADNLTATNIGGAAGRGMEIIANGAGSVITSSTVTNSTFNTNASIGFLYQAINSGVFTTAAINNSSAAANTGRGIYIIAQADGDYGTVSVDNITAQNNTGAGGYGVQFLVTGAGSTVNSATLDNITASGNSLPGISGSATVSGSISSLSISDANVTTSGFSGGVVVDSNASTITNVNISDSTSSGNATRGVYVIAQGGGAISGLTVDNVTAQNNTGASGIGVNIVASGAASTLGATTLGNSLISGNAQAGVYVQGAGTSIMSGVNIHDVTSTANTTNGVYVDDDTTAAFVVDMGGGALGSTGNNRIFSNTGTELRVDLDGGELKAENNWWGVGTGLAGGETTLEVGSTVDSTPFLATDPGP